MNDKNKVTDMTQGAPVSLILRFAFPLIIGNLFQQFYAVVDTIVVGQGVGISALASMGAADWINWLVLWMIQGLTQGFAVLLAQRFGAGDTQGVKRTVCMSALLSLVIGAVFTVLGLCVAQPMLHLLNTPESIMQGAWQYLRVIFAATIIIMAYNMAACILRALGDSKTPLIAMIIAAAINVVLDLLFVLGADWGISGAAAATVIAQLFSFLYCLWAIRRIPALAICKEDWVVDRTLCRHLLRLGVPVSVSQGIIAVGGMVVQSVVNIQGFLFVAGFTATNKLYGVLESTAISFGFALSTYMGQNYGAGRLDRIRAGMRKMIGIAVGISCVISLCMICFGKNLVGLFISGNPEEAAVVQEIAYHYLFIMSCMLFVLYLLHIYRSALQGLGNALVPSVSGVVEFGMRVLVAMLLPMWMGERGIFYAEVAAWTGAAVYLIFGYYRQIGRIAQKWNENVNEQVCS